MKWNIYFNGNCWVIDRYDRMIQVASSEGEARSILRYLKRVERLNYNED